MIEESPEKIAQREAFRASDAAADSALELKHLAHILGKGDFMAACKQLPKVMAAFARLEDALCRVRDEGLKMAASRQTRAGRTGLA